jgi:hypothetical protein
MLQSWSWIYNAASLIIYLLSSTGSRLPEKISTALNVAGDWSWSLEELIGWLKFTRRDQEHDHELGVRLHELSRTHVKSYQLLEVLCVALLFTIQLTSSSRIWLAAAAADWRTRSSQHTHTHTKLPTFEIVALQSCCWGSSGQGL